MPINNDLLNKLYPNKSISQQRGMEASPSPVKLVVTNDDVDNKVVTRYFIKSANSNSQLMEIDAQQFAKFKTNNRFLTIKIDWKIVGNPKTNILPNGVVDLGVEDYNKEQVRKADITFGGLSTYIRDYLEFWYSDDFGNRTFVRETQPSSVAKRPVFSYNINSFGEKIWFVSNQNYVPPTSSITPTPNPSLFIFPSSLNFIVTQSSSVPSSQNISITELGGQEVTALYYLSNDYPWISASLSSSSAPTSMSVFITSSLLPTGSYTSNLIISSSITPLLSNVVLPVNVSVVKFDYETLFMDFYRMPEVAVNLDTYGPYIYNGGSSRWTARDFNLINITSNTSGIARLRHHIPMDRTKIKWYMYRYGAPASNIAGLALAVPTGSAETDYIGIRHISSLNSMDIVFVSSSGATTTLTSVANILLNTSTGTTFTADIVNNLITVFSGSVQIMSASVPESIRSYLTDTSRTVGFYSNTTNQAGGVAFGELDVTRLELQPYTSSIPIWNNTVMHLDAANTASYIGTGEWQDLTGFFNSASAIGTVYTSSAGGAFYFDGNDRMTINAKYSIKPELPATFTTWLNIPQTGSDMGIFTNDLGLGATYRGIWINVNATGSVGINYGSGGSPSVSSRRTGTSSPGTIPTNAWFNLTCVIRGATDMSVYINGVSQSISYTGTGGAISYTTATGSLGYTGTAGSYHLTGSMAVATLFATASTAAQIQTYFDRTKLRFGY